LHHHASRRPERRLPRAKNNLGALLDSRRQVRQKRTEMTTRLILVRHGQIEANIDHRWNGSTDNGLTGQGLEESRRVAAHLARTRPGVEAVYTSPAVRARSTATLIAAELAVPLIVAPGLAEYAIGILEGESFADLAAHEIVLDPSPRLLTLDVVEHLE